MFAPSNIVYIDNFDFERAGDPTRNKYMVVLLQNDSGSVVVTLTTSKDKVPHFHEGKRCVADDTNGVHFYFLPKGLTIGKNGFAFPEDTWIQIHRNITERSKAELEQKYITSNKATLVCELTDEEFIRLLKCLSKSKMTPRGAKREIVVFLDALKNR